VCGPSPGANLAVDVGKGPGCRQRCPDPQVEKVEPQRRHKDVVSAIRPLPPGSPRPCGRANTFRTEGFNGSGPKSGRADTSSPLAAVISLERRQTTDKHEGRGVASRLHPATSRRRCCTDEGAAGPFVAQFGNSPDLGGPLPRQQARIVQTKPTRLGSSVQDDLDGVVGSQDRCRSIEQTRGRWCGTDWKLSRPWWAITPPTSQDRADQSCQPRFLRPG